MDELSIDDNGDGNNNKPIEINNLASVSIWAELSWADLICLPACLPVIHLSHILSLPMPMCVCAFVCGIHGLDARTMYIVPCCSYCFVILALLLLYCVARSSQHERMGFSLHINIQKSVRYIQRHTFPSILWITKQNALAASDVKFRIYSSLAHT